MRFGSLDGLGRALFLAPLTFLLVLRSVHMRKRLLFAIAALVMLLPRAGSACAIGYAWPLHWWMWYDDHSTLVLQTVFQDQIALIQAPTDPRLFISFDPQQLIQSMPAPHPDGTSVWTNVYARLSGFTAADDGYLVSTVVWSREEAGGGCGAPLWVTVIGQLTPDQAGPWGGSVAGATMNAPWIGYGSVFSRGVYNIGRQMSAGQWIGQGGEQDPAYYDAMLWQSQADVVIAEIPPGTFDEDQLVILSAVANGKMAILPSATFADAVSLTGSPVQSIQYAGLTFQYIRFNNGGIINGSTSGDSRTDFGWVTPGYRGATVPTPNYITLAQGFNRVCAILSQHLPPANAGPDQTVDEGTLVQLHGLGGDAGASFAWQQLAGPPVALSGDTTATPSFVAPWLAGGVGSQTLTFQLTVTSYGITTSSTVNIIVRNADHAPVAVPGPPQTVNEGSAVTLDGSKSYDPDGDQITCSWVQTTADASVQLQNADTCKATFTSPPIPGGHGAGVTLSFALTVSDTVLTSQSTTTVTVEQVNHPPVAVAGPNQTVNELTVATLNGSASSDPDGDPFTYAWTRLSGPVVTPSNAASATPSFTAPEVDPGGATLVFQLVVTDSGGLSSPPSTTTVTVQDVNDPPLCDLGKASPSLLWPPNHKMVPVSIVGVTDPQNDKMTITVTGITQDEPVNGTGDGDTSPDGSLMGTTALIRAERAGSGNGRVYQIRFTADDGDGGVCKGAVTVGVPNDAKGVPIDDGQKYDSTKP